MPACVLRMASSSVVSVPWLLNVLFVVWLLRSGVNANEHVDEILEQAQGRRLSVESTDPRRLLENDQLPALEVAGFKLAQVVTFSPLEPWKIRNHEIPADHDLQEDSSGQRRLYALEALINTPLNFTTPREKALTMLMLAAAGITDGLLSWRWRRVP